jgi:hypothetical protein
MSDAVLQIGSEIATEAASSSQNFADPVMIDTSAGLVATTPKTVADMIELWAANPPREIAMLKTTCARLADYHAVLGTELTLDAVDVARGGFRAFLKSRTYEENSIRTYVNHVRLLTRYAAAAGWRPGQSVSPAWLAVLQLAKKHKCLEVAQYLASIRKHPRDVTFEDVNGWMHRKMQSGSKEQSVSKKRTSFWRILRDCGHASKVPNFLLRENNYGIRIQDFPSDLKQEVTGLLEWKQADYKWDRPQGAHHRPPTAKRLAYTIGAVYGYAIRIAKQEGISSLSDLVQRRIIGGFSEWCINTREVKGQTLQRNLRLLGGALRQHPRYADLDLSWFTPLLNGLPVEPDSVLKRRRAERVVEYAAIERIPGMMRTERIKAVKKGQKKLAILVRDEFMIRWLTLLPWRQRNVRECRVGGTRPNLYKGPVPAITTIDMPPWARDERERNPKAEFWQFHFTEDETKTGCAVDSLVPHQLIEPLEEYLHEFRPHLLAGGDPGTLFLNQAGNPMSIRLVTTVVARTTLTYTGHRVTPHPFRDIVAFAWLKDHPRDYLTVSKMLWHSSPNEVIKTYGSLFNESSGVCAMEAWADEREERSRH